MTLSCSVEWNYAQLRNGANAQIDNEGYNVEFHSLLEGQESTVIKYTN